MQSLPSLQAHQSQASAPQQGLDQNAQRTFTSFFPTPGSFPQSYPNVPFPLMPYFTTNLPDQNVRDYFNLFNVRDSTSKERDDDLFDTRKSYTTDRIHDHTRERSFRNNSNSNSQNRFEPRTRRCREPRHQDDEQDKPFDSDSNYRSRRMYRSRSRSSSPTKERTTRRDSKT